MTNKVEYIDINNVDNKTENLMNIITMIEVYEGMLVNTLMDNQITMEIAHKNTIDKLKKLNEILTDFLEKY